MINLLFKFKARIVEHKRDVIAVSSVLLIVTVIGCLLDAWLGVLKGDDAYYHAGMVQFIVNNFPTLNWQSQIFAGYPPLEFETPLFYFILAALKVLTGLSIELLIQMSLFVAVLSLAISIYILARRLRLSPWLSAIFALLFFSIPEVWNWIIIGGAYKRVVALPFIFLAIACVYNHIEQINLIKETKKTYILVIIVLTLVALIHPLIAQFILPSVFFVYLFGVRKARPKIESLVKVFVPVVGLVAWQYIPLLSEYLNIFHSSDTLDSPQYTVPMLLKWLIQIPDANVWGNYLGPLVIPFLLLSMICLFIFFKRFKEIVERASVELVFCVIFVLLSLYFFIFGWFYMPTRLYLMATYDHVIWLGIASLLTILFTASILIRGGFHSNTKNWVVPIIYCVFSIIVVIAAFSPVPFLKNYTQIQYPSNDNPIKQIVSVAQSFQEPGTRIYNSQRRLTTWIYYSNPTLDIAGGRSHFYAKHVYYHEWSDASINYQSDKNGGAYFEDFPKVQLRQIGGADNYYSAMFWLDWYGSNGTILLPAYYPQLLTVQGYLSRPQYFVQHKTERDTYVNYYIEYPSSSPVAVSTNANVIALPFQSGDAPPFYTDFIELLSSLNLNSQWIIPIKLENAKDLKKFSSALVDYDTYINNKLVLDDFMNNGGNLVVMGNENQGKSAVTINIRNEIIEFQANASPMMAPLNSISLAESKEGVIAYRMPSGKGTNTILGITFDNLIKSDSLAASLLLTQAIAPEINLSKQNANIKSSSVSYQTTGIAGGIVNSSDSSNESISPMFWKVSWKTDKSQGQIRYFEGYEELQSEINGDNPHNQVNYSAFLSDSVSIKSGGYLEFDIWSDNIPLIDAAFFSSDHNKYNRRNVEIAKGEWVHNTIPFSAFDFPNGDFDSSQELVFAVNDNPAKGLSDNNESVIVRIRNLKIFSPNGNPSETEPSLTFVADHSVENNQINWELPFTEQLPTDSNAIINFSLWNDGNPVSSIGITLEHHSKDGYLYYDLPDTTWNGWKDITIPLSYFRSKTGDLIDQFDSLVLNINENAPYQHDAILRQFKIQNVSVTTLINDSIYSKLDGEWDQADRFILQLGDNKKILWKESYLPSWQIKDNHGQPVDYYFAGPGMIYLQAPQDTNYLIFEMPIPRDRVAGIIVSIISVLGFISYFCIIKRRINIKPLKRC